MSQLNQCSRKAAVCTKPSGSNIPQGINLLQVCIPNPINLFLALTEILEDSREWVAEIPISSGSSGHLRNRGDRGLELWQQGIQIGVPANQNGLLMGQGRQVNRGGIKANGLAL